MKSYLLTGLFLSIGAGFVYSQTPEAFNFQGVARDFRAIHFQIRILDSEYPF